jgi:hypothetical protein
MVCYDEPVVANHGVVCCAIRCDSWWAMLSQWLWILVYYAEPVFMNHTCYADQVIVNYGVL